MNNLNYSKRMYVSPNIENINEIKNLLDTKTSIYGIYLICISNESKNLFDIIHSTEVFKTIYTVKSFTIIGIAQGKKDSFVLTSSIIEDFYNLRKNLDGIHDFFLCKREI